MTHYQHTSSLRPATSHFQSPTVSIMSDAESLSQQPFQHEVTLRKPDSSAPHFMGSYPRYHHHKLSDSTNTTGSSESSPTGTYSVVDDSSATEPSPGSSPESPPPTSFNAAMMRPRTADETRGTFFEMQKQPIPKKGRNLKNLAVNTSGKPGQKPAGLTLPLRTAVDPKLSILSPAFVKPPTPPRRKPAALGLTIMTPGLSRAPPQEIRLAIPPTPGFSKPATLRHFQSSPSLPLVTGLSFPSGTSNNEKRRPQPLDTLFSPLKESFHAVEEEEEQNFDVPLSREEKPEAYPDGPICVYGPGVYLYLEPTAAQASTFDVIFNVASEVRNPFVEPAETPAIEPDIRIDGGGGIQYAPRRPEAEPIAIEASAQPVASSHNNTAEVTEDKMPEYIHIPWEHNSDIVPELLALCKTMDEKVSEGKRVLVHCQCGVSRSASLVVAYGLYKAPQLSVQEAYDAVKTKSKWIGPNMNLIMQLQEFRSSLANGGRLASNRGSGMSPITPSSAMSEWRSPFARQSSFGSQDRPLSGRISPSVENKNSVDLGSVSPGPSSAPLGGFWPRNGSTSSSIKSMGTVRTTSAFVDPSGHVVPVLNVVDSNHPDFGKSLAVPESVPMSPAVEAPPMELPLSPRATEFAMLPLQPPKEVDSVDKFGLMSPTAHGFGHSFFDRSALLASLGMGSMGRDEDTPRRSLTGRNRDSYIQPESQPAPQPAPPPAPRMEPLSFARRLRKKISAPSIREQEQLQSLQAKIKASLPLRRAAANLSTVDEALTSPRATEFTRNPFALTVQTDHRPHDPLRPRTSDGSDPRSPAFTGANPITRNIYDVL